MTENDIPTNPPIDGSITPPSTDLQQTPANLAAPALALQPDLVMTERSFAMKMRWPHPNVGWSLLWCMLFVFITQIPGAFIAVGIITALYFLKSSALPAGALNSPGLLMKSEAMNWALGGAFFITELIVIGFSWFIIRLVIGRDWKRQLALRCPSFSHTLLALAGLPAMWLLASIVYDLLRTTFHVPSLADFFGGLDMKEMEKIFTKWPWGFAVLVIGLGPGIGEELWCRGFLGRGLIANYGVVFGIVATSFFFGLIHLDPCQGTMAMLIGLWLHFVYLATRSLLVPMLLHFVNNSLSVLALRLSSLELLDSDAHSIPPSVYVTAMLLLAGVAYALYQSRARLVARSSEQILAWRPAFEGVECPPSGSDVRVVHPALSPAAGTLALASFLLFVWACASWFIQDG